MSFVLAVVCGYCVGSVPFGLLLARLRGVGDLRQQGSGNIGATNALRAGGVLVGGGTLLLDAGKGACVFLFFSWMTGQEAVASVAGAAAVVGHVFPVWLKFKGGKGVATALGVFLAASPLFGGAVCALWLLTLLLVRYVSVASLVSVTASVVIAFFVGGTPLLFLTWVCAMLVWRQHRPNIQRLKEGEEPRLGRR